MKLDRFKSQVISHAALSASLSGYLRPNDKISDLISGGTLLPLRRGLYALAASPTPARELVANHLYGPSHVSLQYALAYHGLLPEQATTVTSVCIGRSRVFTNSLGRFSYTRLPKPYYAIGYTSIDFGEYAFLMARPEKALSDMLVTTRNLRIQSARAMLTYLLVDLRLEESHLASLDTNQLETLVSADYKPALIRHLVDAIVRLTTNSP